MKLKEFGNIFLLHKNKMPYSAYTKKLTNINNRANLCSYEMAQSAYNNCNYYDGIGVALGKTSAGTLCGLDIDDCIDKQGNIAKNALEIINLLNTYTEKSISGNGVHCLFIADKKGKICKNNSLEWCKCLEIYDKSRFFTLSGNILYKKDVELRQKECNIIYEKYFIPKQDNAMPYITAPMIVKSNKNHCKSKTMGYISVIERAMLKDLKLAKYWHANGIYSDESRNDLGFFQKLTHYTDCNSEIMRELALISPYFNHKDAKHKEKWVKRKDYLERTIFKAIENYRSYNYEQ